MIYLDKSTPGPSCLDNAIHRINYYPLDSAIGFASVYPLDMRWIALSTV